MKWFRLLCAAVLSTALGARLNAEPASLTIQSAEKPASAAVGLPALPADAKGAVLAFDARLVAKPNSGWSNALSITVNGTFVGARRADGLVRLLDRGESLKIKTGTVPYCRNWRGGPKWLLFSAPAEGNEVDSRVISDREHGCRFRLDVSDLVKPGEPVKVTFGYCMTTQDLKGNTVRIAVRDIALESLKTGRTAAARKLAYPAAFAEPLSCDIPNGDRKPQAVTLKFPAVKVPNGTIPVLFFNARIRSEGFGGWNPFIALTLNGQKLEKMTGSGRGRLLKRGNVLKTSLPGKKELDYFQNMRGRNSLLTFFAPLGTEEMDPRVLSDREHGYDYYLDVSDVLNRLEIGADQRVEKDTPNELIIQFQLLKSDVKSRELPLLVRDINILFLPAEEVLKANTASLRKLTSGTPAARLAGPAGSSLEVDGKGVIKVRSGDEDFYIYSRFSYPASPAMKFNLFSDVPKDSEPGWAPAVRQEKGAVKVSARGKYYAVDRTVTPLAEGWKVVDSFTSCGGEDCGIAVSIDAGSNELDFLKYKLAGQSGANVVSFFGSANPTVFVPGRKAAVALAAEDMVSRAQLVLRAQGNQLSLATDGVGLPQGGKLIREWVIVPAPDGEYFTAVNTLRRMWDLNYTLPGPFNAVNLKNRTWDGLDTKVMFFTPFHAFDKGAAWSDDEYLAKLKPQLEATRKKLPDAYLLGSIETNLVPFDTRSVPWGVELKPRRGKRGQKSGSYGAFASKEVTAKLDAATPYKDSIIRDKDGNAMLDNFYAEYPFVDLMVQPEMGNMRFKRFLEQIDFLMDKVGFNGIYLDQFNPYLIGGFSDDRWDGYTVELAPDGKIARKRYSYAITGTSARVAIIRHAVAKGGIVLTNGQPLCKEEMIPGRLSFQEMENDEVDPTPFLKSKPPEFRWQAVSHLGVPLALGLRPCKYDNYAKRPNRCAEILTKGVITALRNGLMTYAYSFDIHTDGKPDSGSYELFNKMFPITPTALHEGWIEGKERTVTTLSGSYRSAGKKKPVCYFFNSFGVPRPGECTVTGTPGAWQAAIKLDDWNEVAVLVHQ